MALRDRRCATGPLGGTAHRTTRPPPPSPRDPRLPSPRGRRSPDPPLASSSTRNRVHPDGKPGKRKDTRMKRTGFRLFRFDRSCVSGCVVFRDLTSTVQLRVVQPRSPVSAGFTRFLAGWALSRGEGGTSARRLFVLRGRQASHEHLISKRKSARQASPDTTLTSSCMCHPCARAQAYAPRRGTTSQHFSSRS